MDPIYELKLAIINHLRGDSAITALVGDRIFDINPEAGKAGAVFPYISMGPWTAGDDSAECIEAFSVDLQIDVLSSGAGEAASTAQASKLADMIRRRLKTLPDLATNACDEVLFRSTRLITLNSAAGIAKQAASTFTASVEVK